MIDETPGRKARQEVSAPLSASQDRSIPDTKSFMADRVVAAQKLAGGALDLLRVYMREHEPRPLALVDDARTRLQLALAQLEGH